MKPLGPTTDIGKVRCRVPKIQPLILEKLDVEYYKLCNKLNLKIGYSGH